MTWKNYIGILGTLLVIAGGLSPMLRIPIVGNWNYFDLDVTLASIVFILAGLGLLASIVRKPGLLRFAGFGVLFMVLLTLVGVYFKIHDTFSFIPFKKLASVAAGLVKYNRIGWGLLFLGSVLMIIAGKKDKIKTISY
jgi:hypothetical protein